MKAIKALALTGSLLAFTTLTSCDELDLTDIINGVTGQGDEFMQCMGINSTADLITGIADATKDDVNCPKFQTLYDQEVANEGKLISDAELSSLINSSVGADFAMSMTLNATAINKLFKASNDWTYESLGFGIPYLGIGGCDAQGLDNKYSGDTTSCLTVTMDFTLGVKASLKFGVPVTGTVASDLSKTEIFIDLKHMQLLKLSANGSALNTAAKLIVNTAINKLLSDKLPKVHLFDIAAWDIGNKDIKLVAGAPKVHMDQATGYEALELGMYTNLFAQPESINIARDMPQEAEVGLHIHPQLIRGIIARMMTEQNAADGDTFVTRSISAEELNDTTKSSGGFHVSMTDLSRYPNDRLYACSSDWRDYFTFGLRLWSTDTFCGYMDVLAGMNMTVSDKKFSIGLGNIHGGYSDGAMSIASGALNAFAGTNFFKDLLEYTNFSVNFNEMSVAAEASSDGTNAMKKASLEAHMDADEHFHFSVSGTGIALYLNFVDL